MEFRTFEILVPSFNEGVKRLRGLVGDKCPLQASTPHDAEEQLVEQGMRRWYSRWGRAFYVEYSLAEYWGWEVAPWEWRDRRRSEPYTFYVRLDDEHPFCSKALVQGWIEVETK